ncbi:MAG: A/G-specific adenine glycosylase [Bacteroidota bacterium]|jgi:A/G-specific adenine glycosylase
MKAMNPARVKIIRKLIHTWYRTHQRPFIWRTLRDPYAILLSEIMLQQTQADRVEEKLPLFLKKFPTFDALAGASKADILRAWQGLGYNNRAARLWDLARIVVEQFGGKLPADVNTLERLPGIGLYTARAVACFAFRKHTSVVDVNVRRVLSRIFWKRKTCPDVQGERDISLIAEQILPRDTQSWNQALMDLGSTTCKAQKPHCLACPVSRTCRSRHLNPHQKRRSHSGCAPKKVAMRVEPVYLDVPRRIWRGSIVEVLRSVNGRGSISMPELGKSIKPDFTNRELPWLSSLIDALLRDDIVSTTGRRNDARVMLAHK